MNKHRGEMELKLGGKTYVLRPSFAAIVEFEDKSGMTAFEAMKMAGERCAVPMKAITAAFWAGIRGGWEDKKRPPSFEEIGEAVQADGLASLIPQYVEFLGNALSSDAQLAEASKATEGNA